MTSVGKQGAIWAVFGAEALAVLYDLRWLLVLAFVLIIADLWWGTSESKKRYREAKEKKDKQGMKDYEWHVSRAGRRTLCKIVDYLTYLLMGCLLGLAIFEPLGWTTHQVTSIVGLGLGCLCEVASIVTHVLYVKYGITVDVKDGWKIFWKFVFNFLLKFIKKKDAVSEAIEETLEENAKK